MKSCFQSSKSAQFFTLAYEAVGSILGVKPGGAEGGVKKLAPVQGGRDTRAFAKIRCLLPVSVEIHRCHIDFVLVFNWICWVLRHILYYSTYCHLRAESERDSLHGINHYKCFTKMAQFHQLWVSVIKHVNMCKCQGLHTERLSVYAVLILIVNKQQSDECILLY